MLIFYKQSEVDWYQTQIKICFQQLDSYTVLDGIKSVALYNSRYFNAFVYLKLRIIIINCMIDSKYFIKCKLGAGGSSDVFYVVDQNDSKYAVKIMRKPNNSLDGWHISTLQKEYFIMEMLSLHPNILKCVESVCDDELEHNGHKFTINYNITEYACNGTLSSSFIELAALMKLWAGSILSNW